jgi:hypothetical protein
METVYRKFYGKFETHVYLLRNDILVYKMTGYAQAEHVQEYLDDLIKATEICKPKALIADARLMKTLNKDFQTAVQDRFWPAIAELGITKNPAVMPVTAITQQSVKRMVRVFGERVYGRNGKELYIAVLDTLEDCVAWIDDER